MSRLAAAYNDAVQRVSVQRGIAWLPIPGPLAFIAAISVVHLAIPLRHILAGAQSINAFLTNDDTYYYLQTAWNTRHLGFVTFDGINPTNGVQFLWFATLYVTSWLTDDKPTFLVLASLLNVILTLLPYGVIAKISGAGWTSPRSLIAVIMAAVWLIVCLYEPNQYLISMESALHAFIIWMIVYLYSKIQRRSRAGSPINTATVLASILLLVLNTWTRLDSAGLSAVFLVLFAFAFAGVESSVQHGPLPNRLPNRAVVGAAMLVVSGAAVLFSFFYLAGGSLLPVSALVKGYYVDRLSLGAFYNWSLVLFPLRIPGANLLNILGILSLFVSVAALFRMRAAAEARHWSDLRFAALGLAASVLIHSIVTFGMFHYYYFWYLSASFVYWTIVSAIFVTEVATRKSWSYSGTALVTAVLAVLLVCAWAATAAPNNLAVTRYHTSKWIDANLEKDAILASFNAGQLGFFTNRSVVNLDGLVNNATYFETVLHEEAPEPLAAYLDRVGVDYVVDYQLGRWRGVIENRFTTVREFALASGGTVKVMARIPRSGLF